MFGWLVFFSFLVLLPVGLVRLFLGGFLGFGVFLVGFVLGVFVVDFAFERNLRFRRLRLYGRQKGDI